MRSAKWIENARIVVDQIVKIVMKFRQGPRPTLIGAQYVTRILDSQKMLALAEEIGATEAACAFDAMLMSAASSIRHKPDDVDAEDWQRVVLNASPIFAQMHMAAARLRHEIEDACRERENQGPRTTRVMTGDEDRLAKLIIATPGKHNPFYAGQLGIDDRACSNLWTGLRNEFGFTTHPDKGRGYYPPDHFADEEEDEDDRDDDDEQSNVDPRLAALNGDIDDDDENIALRSDRDRAG